MTSAATPPWRERAGLVVLSTSPTQRSIACENRGDRVVQRGAISSVFSGDAVLATERPLQSKSKPMPRLGKPTTTIAVLV
jgi:hypothetical protein